MLSQLQSWLQGFYYPGERIISPSAHNYRAGSFTKNNPLETSRAFRDGAAWRPPRDPSQIMFNRPFKRIYTKQFIDVDPMIRWKEDHLAELDTVTYRVQNLYTEAIEDEAPFLAPLFVGTADEPTT